MKKVIITGGNRGIGLAIANELVAMHHEVVIVVRREEDGVEVLEDVKGRFNSARISFIQGDLSTVDRCLRLVDLIKHAHPDFNVLINNAGVWMTEKQLNQEGIEMSFMVNYLAPFILCKQLLNALQVNAPSRIVNINAGLYVKGNFDPEKTPIGSDFHPIKTYANSKLCGAMFVKDFAEQLEGTNVTINAVHPGVIRTGLGDSPKLISRLVGMMKVFWKPPTYGAQAPVWLAIDEETANYNGKYFNENSELAYSEKAEDEPLRKSLRELTMSILNKYSQFQNQ